MAEFVYPQRVGGGGLGLRSARAINQTALLKARWHLITAREDVWVKTIKSKYKVGNDLVPKINRESGFKFLDGHFPWLAGDRKESSSENW